MSNTETAIAADQAVYTYERDNGTIEHAQSAEDAIARCPVLGGLALEAPEQVNVLLELAAAGNAKMQAEAATKSESAEKLHGDQKPEMSQAAAQPAEPIRAAGISEPMFKIDTAPGTTERAIIEHVKPLESSDVATTVHRAELLDQTLALEAVYRTDASDAEADPFPAFASNSTADAKVEHTEAARQPMKAEAANEVTLRFAEPSGNERVEPEAPVLAAEDNISEAVIFEPHKDVSAADIAHVTAIAEHTAIEEETAAIEPANDFDMLPAPAESLAELAEVPATEDEANTSSIITAEIETSIEDGLELLFDPETVDTYRQLLAMVDDAETPQADLSEIEESENIVTFETQEVADSEETTVSNDFERFVVTRASEKPLALEAIQEEADGQPLEQTLVQLAEHLSVESEMPDQPERNELQGMLQEIKISLPACYMGGETDETEAQITPEVTDKLLVLLRSLGYQHPREALIGFVDRYSLAFLLQALEYLCQLNNEANRREFLLASVAYTFNDDEGAQLRLGKVLLAGACVV